MLGTKRTRTTSYDPCANGLVERFHRQLKAALKSYSDSSKWTELLPLILLSIRTTVKSDNGYSPAELVYGTTFRLPGDFVSDSINRADLDPAKLVDGIRYSMQQIKPATTRAQQIRTHAPQDLQTCSHVFVRHDAVRSPLQPPYAGPFKVIRRTEKCFVLDVKGKDQTISIDRLKVAHLDSDYPPSTSSQSVRVNDQVKEIPKKEPYIIRSGRQVRFPDHFEPV